MDNIQKNEIIRQANERRQKLNQAKEELYNRDTGKDVLDNFKRNGERLDISPFEVLFIYMFKHVDSIERWFKQYLKTGKDIYENESEDIISRLDDLRNYLDLTECMIREREGNGSE